MKMIDNREYLFNFMRLSKDDKSNIDISKKFNYCYANDAGNAFLRVENFKGNLDYIKGLFTLKKGQRNAIKLLNQYQEENKVDIVLHCNDKLRKYYIQNGFEEVVSCTDLYIMWRPYVCTK